MAMSTNSRLSPAPEPLPATNGHTECLGFDPATMAELIRSRSADECLHADGRVDAWISERLNAPDLNVRQVPLAALERWQIDRLEGNICHATGRFFSLIGVKVRHRFGFTELEWDQPIIDQPEVGILGILAKSINGVLHFCLQAKEEPGNLNGVQLSPTVQATYSNYTRAHGGDAPPLVEHFLDPVPQRLLFAKLQTEDGGRFLYKSNRNMIVRLADQELPELGKEFIWLTLRQIARLGRRDNLLHACTRSVLSPLFLPQISRPKRRCLDIDTTSGAAEEPMVPLVEIIQWLDDRKATNHLFVKREGLNDLKEWEMTPEGCFAHRDRRFFRVIGIDVASASREVTRWSQPILDNPETGVIGLLMKVRQGQRFFLMQAKVEVGNRHIVQLGPTVQFTPGNYLGNARLPRPFLFDEFSGSSRLPVVSQSWQAEEGARFYQETHLHRILALPEGEVLEPPPEFRWISEAQLRFFLHMGEYVNSCARSIISCIL
jgi:dTDP-4-dehydro-6-deoxy-alpha-D-glucopyranose 2,3-dehydratase